MCYEFAFVREHVQKKWVIKTEFKIDATQTHNKRKCSRYVESGSDSIDRKFSE